MIRIGVYREHPRSPRLEVKITDGDVCTLHTFDATEFLNIRDPLAYIEQMFRKMEADLADLYLKKGK